MEPTAAATLLSLLGEKQGAFLPENPENWTVSSVCIDSRKAEPGALFVPLAGENVDGHEYIPHALANGAAGFLANAGRTVPNIGRALFVADTKAALFALAGAYRQTLSPLMVSVTGSVGKTTTKDLLADILATQFETCKTEGNFNNEIGLPLTLLRLKKRHTAAVTELGMSALGEIALLAKAAKPDIGIITHIGTAHIEQLQSRENIAKAKLELASAMAPGKTLLISGLEPLLQNCLETAHLEVLAVGRPGDFLWAENIREEPGKTKFTLGGAANFSVVLPLPGAHNVQNALLAIAAGLKASVSPENIAKALANTRPAALRQRLFTQSGVTILEDCYNASPDSMEAALAVLQRLPGKRFALLGDMLELGSYTESAHRALGLQAAASADVLVACGSHMEHAVEAAKEILKENALLLSKTDAAAFLANAIAAGDSLLAKGSRGMRMEEVLQAFLQESPVTKDKQEAQ